MCLEGVVSGAAFDGVADASKLEFNEDGLAFSLFTEGILDPKTGIPLFFIFQNLIENLQSTFNLRLRRYLLWIDRENSLGIITNANYAN